MILEDQRMDKKSIAQESRMEVTGVLWMQTNEILSYIEKYSIYLFHQEKNKAFSL